MSAWSAVRIRSARDRDRVSLSEGWCPRCPWLRTNGVHTNGAAATVMRFDRLEKKVHPGTFGEIIKVG